MSTIKPQSVSLLLHLLAAAMVLFWNSRVLLQTPAAPLPKLRSRLILLPRPPRPMVEHRSGGSHNASSPARQGTPPPPAPRQFIAPERLPDPKLPIIAGVEFEAPPVTLVSSVNGDPYGVLGGQSPGSGGRNGIGDGGCCFGIGAGKGPPGVDGSIAHTLIPPKLIYKVEPEFSEEARQAKFQGTVVLSIEVDIHGRPSRMAVISSPGLGLDQKAIEAVAQWRFRPGYRDGRPYAQTARIEVSFHLL